MGGILSAMLGVVREMAKEIREGRSPHSGLYVLLLMGLFLGWFFICTTVYDYIGARMIARTGVEFPAIAESFWWDWEKAIAPLVLTIYLTLLSFTAFMPAGAKHFRRAVIESAVALGVYLIVSRAIDFVVS